MSYPRPLPIPFLFLFTRILYTVLFVRVPTSSHGSRLLKASVTKVDVTHDRSKDISTQARPDGYSRSNIQLVEQTRAWFMFELAAEYFHLGIFSSFNLDLTFF